MAKQKVKALSMLVVYSCAWNVTMLLMKLILDDATEVTLVHGSLAALEGLLPWFLQQGCRSRFVELYY